MANFGRIGAMATLAGASASKLLLPNTQNLAALLSEATVMAERGRLQNSATTPAVFFSSMNVGPARDAFTSKQDLAHPAPQYPSTTAALDTSASTHYGVTRNDGGHSSGQSGGGGNSGGSSSRDGGGSKKGHGGHC